MMCVCVCVTRTVMCLVSGAKCDRVSLLDSGEETRMCPLLGIRTVPGTRDP